MPPELSSPGGPDSALLRGGWVKLICGASNQDLASIEDLAAIYSLVGVHCIDVAADRSVVAAARRGIAWACRRGARAPWLMLSLSDGADPHFRKAWFDPRRCPPDCARPCQRVCPADAIAAPGAPQPGVQRERCYGCGRCLPACPLGLIEERGWLLEPADVPPLLRELRPDAVELHTQAGRQDAFCRRLDQLVASGWPLRRLAVSCGLEAAAGQSDAMPLTPAELARELWQRHGALRAAGFRPLWQLDGRPMRGDLGPGTAHAAVRLLAALAPLAPPGPLQLAGGTNGHTLTALEAMPGWSSRAAGVAFGSVARSLLQPLLLQAEQRGRPLRAWPELVDEALGLARQLVGPWLRRGAHAAG